MRETVAVAYLVAAAISLAPGVVGRLGRSRQSRWLRASEADLVARGSFVGSGRDRITLSLAAIYPSPRPEGTRFPKEGGPRQVRDRAR